MASAQNADSTLFDPASPKVYLPHTGEVEFFAGLDLSYRDISLDHMYDILLNVTPGFKWHITDHTMLSIQGWIPVINMYGDYYSLPRLNVLAVSHEFKWGSLAFKPSAGMFSKERYGIDLKAMLPVTEWFALEAQVGLTGRLSLVGGWQMSTMSKLTLLCGADFYIPRWNTQFRISGGRYLYDDNGFIIDGMRHFDHTSVGLYLQWSDKTSRQNGFNAGFKVVIAIPPYGHGRRAVRFRPANNFRLTYNMNADSQSCKIYDTDPEQNERHGWFSPDILPWGANLIHDFTER